MEPYIFPRSAPINEGYEDARRAEFPGGARMTFSTVESWSTQQLAEFAGLFAESADEQWACQRGVERAAEALEAEIAVLIRSGQVVGAIGFGAGEVPVAQLLDALDRRLETVELDRAGRAWVLASRLEPESRSALIVGRFGKAGFSQEEYDLLRGMARVFSLTLRMLTTLDQERELRRDSQREARQRKQAERQLAHQALHDVLTGLPNRTLLRDRAVQAVKRGSGSSLVAAVIADLDQFTVANEVLGHDRADELLVRVGRRLTDSLRGGELVVGNHTVGRLGGDQFLVLCEGLASEHDAVAVAKLLQDALRAPFELDAGPWQVTASLGIAITECETSRAEAATIVDELFRDVEVATARAKEAGRDRFEMFDHDMGMRLRDRLQLESDLRAALGRDELWLAYQPVVAVEDSSVVMLEALIRWSHPVRGELPPLEFIPVAEQSDLIVRVGEWVIEEACKQLARWQQTPGIDARLRVSVNVSARQLTGELVEFLERTLRDTGIEPADLAIELTETLLIERADVAETVLSAIRDLGVGIVLDDFGCGYSSLGYLKEFELDQIKLDRSFTFGLVDDPRDAKLVSATVELARALGLTVVVEGVENAEQLRILQHLHCDFAQGYYFGRPQRPEELLTRLREATSSEARAPSELEPALADAGIALRSAGAHMSPQQFIGRLAGLFFCLGGALTAPAQLLMGGRGGPRMAIGLGLLGLVSGVVCLRVPWRRVSLRWTHVITLLAIAEVALVVWSLGHPRVFSWFYVLIAVAIGYAAERRTLIFYILLLSVVIQLPVLDSTVSDGLFLPYGVLGAVVLAVTVLATAELRGRLELQQLELRQLALRDPLTGVGNYRLLHDRLEYELRRHARTSRSFAMLTIDLDRFKEINDQLGRSAGDEALRRVGRALHAALRQQDTVVRQGGDEFAVIAPETDDDGAAVLAGRIRERIASVKVGQVTLGAAIGTAIYPNDGPSAQLMLARADARLLEEKASQQPPKAAARSIAPPALDTAAPVPLVG